MTFAALSFVLSCVLMGSGRTPWPPSGWRLPTKADYSADWVTFRKEVPTPFHVRADFNGDGIPDYAWILLRTTGHGWGLFVRLSRKGAGHRVLQLLEEQHGSLPQNFGIFLVRPGHYATACGKGYRGCGPGEPKILKLTRPALEFFKYESASSIFFWDAQTNAFQQVAISN